MDGLRKERQSSIEDEPRTLNLNQIEFAREAALYVVNTRSIQEAFSIFTEGLEPVVRCAGGGRLMDGGDEEEEEDQKYGNDERSNRMSRLRDIVTAPF